MVGASKAVRCATDNAPGIASSSRTRSQQTLLAFSIAVSAPRRTALGFVPFFPLRSSSSIGVPLPPERRACRTCQSRDHQSLLLRPHHSPSSGLRASTLSPAQSRSCSGLRYPHSSMLMLSPSHNMPVKGTPNRRRFSASFRVARRPLPQR
jgi:hypothetical protein